MHRPHFRKGSFANVTAVAALVIAMGGTSAYAATLITSKQIKNNTIKSIDVHNGTLTSADLAPGTVPAPYGGSYAYSTNHDGGISIQNQVSGADPTLISLDVPAGSYVFVAKTSLENGATSAYARCTLSAGGDSDVARAYLEPSGGLNDSFAQSVALQVVHTFSSAGTARLTCWSGGPAASAANIKLTGIKVDHLSNVAG